MLEGAAANTTLANTLAAIKNDCKNKNFDAAKARLANLDTADGGKEKKNAAYKKRRNGLKARAEAIISKLPANLINAVKQHWDAAETEIDHVKRMKLLDNVEVAIPGLKALEEARDSATASLGALDNGGTYKILKAARDFEMAGEVAKAKDAYAQVPSRVVKLTEFLALKQRVTDVKNSYDAAETDPIKLATDALDGAETAATSEKLDDATTTLSAFLKTPEIVLLDKEVALYKSRYKDVKARHERIVGMMHHPAAQTKLTTPWAEIETKGETDKNYIAAMTLMDTHVLLMEETRPYVEARLRAKRALEGLHKIADKVPAPVKADVYKAPLNKQKMDKALSDAEVEAAKGDFAKATKAFNDLLDAAKDRMKIAAKGLETKEHGHFLSGHGPDVSRQDTLARMTTGVRPDGAVAPAGKSSQFEDIGDFLACYDMAWEAAKSTKTFFGGTEISQNDPCQVRLTIDAGKAIGMGVTGLAKQTGFAKGEIGETDLFDTYEVTEGLHMLQAKFIFHFDPPDGSDTVITNLKDYKRAYKAKHNVDLPAGNKCPGYWALNQLLPTD